MKKLFLVFITICIGVIFISRLFYLQVYTTKKSTIFDDNAIRKEFTYPKRGFVFDRNNKLLVANQPSYDVMIVPNEVKPLDTTLFCKLLNITKQKFISTYKKTYRYSPKIPQVFVSQISKENYGVLAEKMRKFKGFYIRKRSLREYQTYIGANVLGNIGEVNYGDIKKKPYYRKGDLIGRAGIEKSYEEVLRGKKGVKYIQKDIFNRNIGSFKNGIYDTLAIPGKDIKITIDHDLQAYGELLMMHKRGGIIAIEPETGEILAMVSSPTYNPNDLVGRKRNANYLKLHKDTLANPLYDRSLQAQYVPGSPFKTIVALVGLQEEVINPKSTIRCVGAYNYGGKKPLGCHCGQGKRNLINGISRSCNSYFAHVYKQTIDKYENPSESTNRWANHIKSFGLGNYLNNDLSVGNKGFVPNGDYYDRRYKDFRWRSSTTISNAIGQGEVLTTPIQLANMTAVIANRGYYYTPHIIKSIENKTINQRFTTKHHSSIDKQHFEPVIEGMYQVFNNGGTAQTLRIPGIAICGKTGTAENKVKINGKSTQLTDHSIFTAFAPKDNPKIAIAVFIENGYWGSRFAGRIASLMIEKYLKGYTTRKDLENWIFTHSLENEYKKPYSGKPFKINGGAALQVIENYTKPTVN